MSSFDEGLVGELDQLNEASKLVNLLQARENELSRGVFSNKPTEFVYSPKIVTDPKTLFSSIASDHSNELDVNVVPNQVDDANSLQHAEKGYRSQIADKLSDDDKSLSSSDQGSQTSDSSYAKRNEEPRNATTLLEDELTTKFVDAASQNTTDHDGTFGTVVKSAADLNNRQGKNETIGTAVTSVFKRLYNNLTKYLPFLTQINILKGKSDGNNNDIPVVKAYEKEVILTNDKDEEKEAKFASTNQRVSTPKSTHTTLNNDVNDSGTSEANSKDNMNVNDKAGNKDLPNDTKTELDNKSSSLVSKKQNSDSVTLSGNSYDGPIQGSYDNSMGKVGQDGEHRVHSMRQSTLVMPYDTSHDELAGIGHPASSLLGKYIYAPDHSYLANSASAMQNSKALDLNDEMYTHRSYSRHLQPDLYNTLASLRPMYAAQAIAPEGNSLGLIGNKSNDVYFLVMVAAFCAMAMTVVFAAGLFAYRIQQSRKTSSETDYPTYGVVGPNNMNAKNGAASFVGGYFGNIGHGSVSSGSKNGSIKHLPDMSSHSDSGVATSGKSVGKKASNDPSTSSSRLDFMANQNAARMYHYQHQKQQMIISDRTSNGRHTSASDLDSEDENDDGSYTVYECPGLASAHEMEIKNPLFNDDRTP